MTEPRPRKLRRVIIREEFVALTGNYVRAVLLHQLEYHQKCALDVDRYVAEESERLAQEGVEANAHPTNGWFYKKAADLAEETMLGLDETTIRRHLKSFIEQGWVDERRNPQKKWDRTMQYRLNLVKIKTDLEALNYHLQGWVIAEPVSPIDSTTGKMQPRSSVLPDASCTMQDGSSDLQLQSGKLQEQYQNTSSKHVVEHSYNTNPAGVGVKSEYSLEEVLRYVEHLVKLGRKIDNPEGLAMTLYETGKGDALIKRFLSPPSSPADSPTSSETKSAHPPECPRCYGAQMEVVPGKGARRCTYPQTT